MDTFYIRRLNADGKLISEGITTVASEKELRKELDAQVPDDFASYELQLIHSDAEPDDIS